MVINSNHATGKKKRERINKIMDHRQKNLSVLMFPWLAHGHVSPYLELAKKLTKRNFKIYFCSTPVILNSIKLSGKYSLSIQLIELHLPTTLPELPPHYHTTKGLPLHLMPTLKKAFDMASPSFFRILKNLNPNLVIYDFIQPWAPALALSLNIPAVHFLVTSATMGAFMLHAFENPGDHEFPFSAIFIHDYMKEKFSHLLESSANGMKDKDRLLQCFERSCHVILIKSFRELEGKYIDYLSVLMKKRLVPVGPLVKESRAILGTTHTGGQLKPPNLKKNITHYNTELKKNQSGSHLLEIRFGLHKEPVEEDEDEEEMGIIKWLDKKERSSTVFVSFGSEYFLSKEEMEDVALGLELSQVNFIWVVRFPSGVKVKLEEELPRNFLERTKERAMVVEGWAPQMKILGHPSIGGFVSHCGWSSVMESMKFGVPIVALPMHLDQPLNARLVEEVGVGIEVMRSSKNGRIEKEEMARVIKEVVMEKDSCGEKVRRKAREMGEKIMKKGEEDIEEVVDELIQLCG